MVFFDNNNGFGDNRQKTNFSQFDVSEIHSLNIVTWAAFKIKMQDFKKQVQHNVLHHLLIYFILCRDF